MEEQKRKFLLCRIKKQQKLIISEYDNLKRQFLGKILLRQKHDHFIQQATRLMELNTALASNLFEYLEPSQMQAIFQRINTVYYDLVEKFKHTCHKLQNIDTCEDFKEVRQMCDICHEKIQINKIQKIKQSIQEQSECRTVLIRKLIEQSQMERLKPIFNEQQDRIFKTQLSKIFQKKQMVLQTTINETNIFLTKIQTEITDFMLSFRNQFAHWGGDEQKPPNLNWGKTIKGFIDNKLSKSFHQRIPDWIKRMHIIMKSTNQEPIINSQNKQIQTGNYLSQRQISLTKQLEEITNLLKIRKQELISLEIKFQNQQNNSKHLKQQMEEKYKLYQNQIQQLNKLNLLHPLSQCLVNEDSGQIQNTQQKKTCGKNKQMKLLKKKYIKSNQQYNQKLQSNSNNYRNTVLQQNTSSIKQTSNLNCNQYQSYHGIRYIIDEFGQKIQDLKLKKMIFNCQMKQQLDISTNDYEYINKNRDKDIMRKPEQSVKYTKDQARGDPQTNRKTLISSLQQHHNKQMFVARDNSTMPKRYSTYNKMKGLSINKIGISKESLINSANLLIKRAEGRSNLIQNKKPEFQGIQRNAIQNYLQAFQLLHSIIHTIRNLTGLYKQNNQHQHLINLIQTSFDRLFAQDDLLTKEILVHHIKKETQKSLKRYNTEAKSPISKNISNNNSVYFYNNKDTLLLREKNIIQQKRLRLPKISNHLAKSQIKIEQSQTQQTQQTYENTTLFLDNKMALEYEQSFKTIENDRHSQKPTPRQLQKIQSIYAILQSIKVQDNNLYRQICSFVRYPSSAMKNQCTINELTFSSFCNYFMKIQWLHRQCQIKNQHLFCKHISSFFGKITKMMENNYRKMHKQQKQNFTSFKVDKLI